jgi:hypothetical protein
MQCYLRPQCLLGSTVCTVKAMPNYDLAGLWGGSMDITKRKKEGRWKEDRKGRALSRLLLLLLLVLLIVMVMLLVLVLLLRRGFGHELLERHKVALFFWVALRLHVISIAT